MTRYVWILLKGKTVQGQSFSFSMIEPNVFIRDGKFNRRKVNARALQVMKRLGVEGDLKETWIDR